MDWFAQNWIWVLFAVAFVAMHMFGHGRHGEHGGEQSVHRDSSSFLQVDRKGRAPLPPWTAMARTSTRSMTC